MKRIIEGALFLKGRPMKLDEIKELTGIQSYGYIKKIINELANDYKKIGSAINIEIIGEEVYMHLKPEILEKVKGFAKSRELGKAALRMLAYVSKNEGITKAELAKLFGSSAYEGVKEAHKKGFVRLEKRGRTKAVFTTEKFKEYFKI